MFSIYVSSIICILDQVFFTALFIYLYWEKGRGSRKESLPGPELGLGDPGRDQWCHLWQFVTTHSNRNLQTKLFTDICSLNSVVI